MPTECSPDFFGFEPVEGRAMVAAFDAGAVTSDAGGLLLGATDRAIRMMDRLASPGLRSRHRRHGTRRATCASIKGNRHGLRDDLLPRRRLKLGYLVQEDGEQVRGGLVSGAAGLIGLHCLPKQPFSVRLWHDPVLYQGRETKLRKLKSSDSRGGCMKLVEFLIIHDLSPTCD